MVYIAIINIIIINILICVLAKYAKKIISGPDNKTKSSSIKQITFVEPT